MNTFQGVGKDDNKVLILAATNTPYALDQVRKQAFEFFLVEAEEKIPW